MFFLQSLARFSFCGFRPFIRPQKRIPALPRIVEWNYSRNALKPANDKMGQFSDLLRSSVPVNKVAMLLSPSRQMMDHLHFLEFDLMKSKIHHLLKGL